MIKNPNKFKFTDDYQWDLLRYTVQDKNGERALEKYEDNYFTLIEHQVIAHGLKSFYDKHRKIPGKTMLKERIIRLLNSKDYQNLVTKDDQKDILKLIKPLYIEPVSDGDLIYSDCKDFSRYIKLKNALEDIDINDFNSYQTFSQNVQEAIKDEDRVKEMESSLLIGDLKERQFRRQENLQVFPTPYKQINSLTNAGGYEEGSILVLLDRPKRGKTAKLVNIAREYVKKGKKVLYIDTENGKKNIFSRLEQSIMRLDKRELLSGKHDTKIQKRFRKYKRMGGEIVVERVSALADNCNTLQNIIDRYYKEYGIQFDVMVIDYAAKLASITNTDNDSKRISDVYIELGNLAEDNGIIHIWTANHVKREAAEKHMKSKYVGEDIALCIDIVRHAHAIFGLNRTPEEEEAGFFRMELVDQRDGKPNGRAVFQMDMDIQRSEELSDKQRKDYDENFYEPIVKSQGEEGVKKVSKNKPKRANDDFRD